MPTIGLVANVYQEANALPGWLECHLPFFDDVRILHAGPGGAYSTDGSIELLKKWNVPVEFCPIDAGFGVVRTLAVSLSPCDYVVLLDADERFHRYLRVLTCEGESTPQKQVDDLLYDYGNPNFEKDGARYQDYDKSIDFGAVPSNFENMKFLGANLKVKVASMDVIDQWEVLQSAVKTGVDAVRTIRRHWHDMTFARPTQNWHTDPDYQMRIVKRGVGWDAASRMHERVVGVTALHTPNHTHGPFFDHYHLWFKKMEVAQREHDIAIYNAINEGRTPPEK